MFFSTFFLTPELENASLCWEFILFCDFLPSPSGSSVHAIFQARILEWVAISYRREKRGGERSKNAFMEKVAVFVYVCVCESVCESMCVCLCVCVHKCQTLIH